MSINDLLLKYWGFSAFRPLQKEIIESVLAKTDTLALMPTGGGKSLTYQIPGLAMPGTCLVVSPLIALMKDQTEQLKQKGIKAVAVYSGMSNDEIDKALNLCLFGECKFLYISPERISSPLFRSRVEQMMVNLIAVDEAHCISQWGHDFRPAYLQIAGLRDFFPEVPLLAVTATATQPVIEEIQQQLRFRKPCLFTMSFNRPNLTYLVRETENKPEYMLKVHRSAGGSGIIYVRNRKKARETAEFLQHHGVEADYYHAGLDPLVRSRRQEAWQRGEKPVMVATNAFGMGIDKPDVRYVIHLDLPDTLEAYFQEAGRAGRDGKPAHAILLYHPSDKARLLQREQTAFPEPDFIRRVYDAMGQFLQITLGGGEGASFTFDFALFLKRFRFPALEAYSALQILVREGYIEFDESPDPLARIHFTVARDDLYRFQVKHEAFDHFIKMLLRSYTGLFSGYVAVDEQLLATRAKIPPERVREYLNRLRTFQIITYIPSRKNPLVTYLLPRMETKYLTMSAAVYFDRKKQFVRKLDAVVGYVLGLDCRNRLLLRYFGQKSVPACGRCDFCLRKPGISYSEAAMDHLSLQVLQLLHQEPLPLENLLEKLPAQQEAALLLLRHMADAGKVLMQENGLVLALS
ncbi:MAG: ATP-dependent DNA helicase RecQ [Bacteroidales bacterium]